MPDAYLTAGMPLGRLLPLVGRHGVSPKHLGRFLFLVQSGLAGSGFGREPMPEGGDEAPLFVLGHWRTGTTFLHQLLQHDPRFTAPTLLQVVYPEAFAKAEKYARRIMEADMPAHRPMDRVRLAVDEPQEDEGALWRLTGESPLEHLVFPHDDRFFLLRGEPPRSAVWEAALRDFVRRIAGTTGRRVVLKNPFHSVRVPQLARLFPDARWVWIDRPAREVIPSTVHMWTVVGEQNRLRTGGRAPTVDEVLDVYIRTQQSLAEGFAGLDPARATRLTYAALEADPVGTVGRALDAVGLGLPLSSETSIAEYAASLRGYQKNEHRPGSEVLERIEARVREAGVGEVQAR